MKKWQKAKMGGGKAGGPPIYLLGFKVHCFTTSTYLMVLGATLLQY